jgi:hypothetical protein
LIPLLVVTGLLAVPPVAGVAVQDVAGIGAFDEVACSSSSPCIEVGIATRRWC